MNSCCIQEQFSTHQRKQQGEVPPVFSYNLICNSPFSAGLTHPVTTCMWERCLMACRKYLFLHILPHKPQGNVCMKQGENSMLCCLCRILRKTLQTKMSSLKPIKIKTVVKWCLKWELLHIALCSWSLYR